MRRFQQFKTLFCRSFLLSNMKICYPRRNHKALIIVLKRLFLVHFALYFHLGRITNLNVWYKQTSIEFNLNSVNPSQIVVKPFKSPEILKNSIKRNKLLPIASHMLYHILTLDFLRYDGRWGGGMVERPHATHR